jgi:hypothetical protein
LSTLSADRIVRGYLLGVREAWFDADNTTAPVVRVD